MYIEKILELPVFQFMMDKINNCNEFLSTSQEMSMSERPLDVYIKFIKLQNLH